ncbi:MAG: ECF RNA polymerase sigma factor SigR [Verrucomicrobia subdivision 3 bacterium]|nr:ECF RNA polymerase sigma factor SigR [Limisphaerales bacterium]MCS1415352.1 ECF RNA polymerase sigma factor SigR [Limisphaerales bacterium]
MAELDFEEIVDKHYTMLYRFALTLTHNVANASDLTQQTFYKWAIKGHQLRDPKKLKAWLFTTLHREFLSTRRFEKSHPHYGVDIAESEIPTVTADVVNRIDASVAVAALERIDELFRVPLVLFHLEDYSYKEIAEILEIPIGTVMSRISRGRNQLLKLLTECEGESKAKIVPLSPQQKNQGL